MNRFLLWVMVLIVVGTRWPQLGEAAVISRDWKTPGDGLLTYDDVNRREWLDLTESRLTTFEGSSVAQRYQSALTELSPSGRFPGFGVAMSSDLIEFSRSAGIDETTDSFAINGNAIIHLIALMGVSYGPSATGSSASFGYVAEGSPNILMGGQLAYFPMSGEFGRAQLLIAPGLGDLANLTNTGFWLNRQVPEPSSVILALLLIAVRGGVR